MRFLLVIAGVLLAGALYDFLRVQRLVDHGEAITATIVSVRVQAEQQARNAKRGAERRGLPLRRQLLEA